MNARPRPGQHFECGQCYRPRPARSLGEAIDLAQGGDCAALEQWALYCATYRQLRQLAEQTHQDLDTLEEALARI